MNLTDEQSYWSDKVVKRGTVGKDPLSPSKIGAVPNHTDPSLPISTAYESKQSPGLLSSANHANHRGGNRVGGVENWMPKGYIISVICALSFLALSCSLVVILFCGQSTDVVGGLTDGSSVALTPHFRELDVRDAAWKSEMTMTTQKQQQQQQQEPQLMRRTNVDRGVSCDPRYATLRVYMYDLPSEFHFGILPDFEPSPDALNVWPRNLSNLPRYPGGLYQQHSPEYWLIADILTSNVPGRKQECTAVRVQTPAEADVIFVPFFASLSYNKYSKLEHKDGEDLNVELQVKLVKYLKQQLPWQESGGVDHVIVIHHPNSLHKMRDQLRSAMYIVCDFGRYAQEIANMRKDIVAPYKHVIPVFRDDDSSFETRTTLLFFQGAIVRKEGGIIRQRLYELLKDEEGVIFLTGNTQSNGIKSATAGMRNSKFCLHLAGDTPSSNRLFDAIASHCVPVVISDEIELPFEDAVDYSEFCLFIRSNDALKKGFVIKLLHAIENEEWTKMWLRLHEVVLHFEYQYPSQPSDAVNMVWKALARRAPAVKYKINKGKRYARSGWPQQIQRQTQQQQQQQQAYDDDDSSLTIGNDRKLRA